MLQVSRLIVLIIFSSVLFVGLSQSFTPIKYRQRLLELYKKADRLYHAGEDIVNRKDYTEEKEEQLNKDALFSLKNVRAELEKSNLSFDSLLFFVNFKIGVLEHYFDELAEARQSYIHAINIGRKLTGLEDSFLFKPYLYYGIILYHENLFDSSLTIYKEAERIAESYSVILTEKERLYNTLGALYYETGNYRQAKNYTEKSLAVIPRSNPYYDQLVVNYKINLASILTRLEEYDEANRIYKDVLPLNINRDIVLHNIGVINLKLGSVNKALHYFRQVKYTDSRKVRLFNDMAIAFMNVRQYDSAKVYLANANRLDTTGSKSVTKGQTNQYWGDLLVAANNFREALQKYQSAVTNYYPAYHESDIYKNPVEFSGVFSYINLFTTLTAKAEAFESLYYQEKKLPDLRSALDAYTSAFKLADYVEKTYDSDEARLFLNRIKYGVHSHPIDISLQLYDRTNEKEYLERAWQFDQMNKASILSFNIYENELKLQQTPKEDINREKFIRAAITRLSLKAAKEDNDQNIKAIADAIRDHEIELGKIQEEISSSDRNKNVRPVIPTVKELQEKLLDRKTTLLSYHLSPTDLLILCFNKTDFIYKKIPVDQSFYSTIDTFVRSLHSVDDENTYRAKKISQRLYSWLLQPVAGSLTNQERLIIIPDDELNYVPFEALQDSSENYLVEKFSIQYQYSATLLEKRKRKHAKRGVLSFAPYANSDRGKLPYSAEEIKDLDGERFFDENATKELFLKKVNKFSVIHLATHAKVSDSDPQQSYISFAEKNAPAENRLYAGEIYDLSLDSTKLVILSACETGSGHLVHGEGMMSLSRAFAYAGCPDVVTSLWKAEDKTTAYLTRRLHYYLYNKKTTDKALHLAKLDLLNSHEFDERLKTPNYWAHIIFIGEYEPSATSLFPVWLLILVFFLIFLMAVIIRRKKQ